MVRTLEDVVERHPIVGIFSSAFNVFVILTYGGVRRDARQLTGIRLAPDRLQYAGRT
jgi:hypothetical protein